MMEMHDKRNESVTTTCIATRTRYTALSALCATTILMVVLVVGAGVGAADEVEVVTNNTGGSTTKSVTVTYTTIDEIEIAYDDGSAEGGWSMGPGVGTCSDDGGYIGYTIRMTTPDSEPFTITTIKLFSRRYGLDCNTRFEIWDSDRNTLYSDIVSHSEYSTAVDSFDSATWGYKDVSDVVVSGDFYIAMYTDSSNPSDEIYPDTGVYVGYDTSFSSDRSYTTRGKNLTWDLTTPQATTNWMIRVVGTVDNTDTTPPIHNINKGTNYTTIQAAIDAATPGDEIHVDSGTYYENVIVNKQLILQGVDIGSSLPVVDAMQTDSPITLSADYCTVDGFVVTNNSLSNISKLGSNAGIYIMSNGNIISNISSCKNNDIGIYLRNSSNNNLFNNIIFNNKFGIVLKNSSDNFIIGNKVFNNTGFSSNGSNNQPPSSTGILITGSNNIMKNNNVSNNYIGIGVINRGSTEDYLTYNNTIENNTIFNNSIPQVNGSDDTLRGGILIGGILNGTSNDTLKNNSLIDNEIGIRIKNSNYLTISENSVASSNTYGLLLINSSNSDINNNYIYGCAGNGSPGEVFGIGIIIVESSHNNNLSSNNVSENWNGIFLIDSSQNILDNNTANNNIYAPAAGDVGPPNTGFYLENSSDNTFIKNTANNNNYGVFLSNSAYNTLINNTANNNAGIEGEDIYFSSNGILLTDSSQNTLSSNTVSNNSMTGIGLKTSNYNTLIGNNASNNIFGIGLKTSSNNKLSDNNASNNSITGIPLNSSSNNTLSGNTVSNNNYGIWLGYSSNNNTLSGNTASNNSYYGILLYHSSNNNMLIGNTASNNFITGIWLDNFCYNNTLSSNTASNNSITGIWLYYSSNNNTLSGNTASNNDYGIYLDFSSNNILYHNNLVNNTVDNAYDTSGNNQWDNAYPNGGNYWSDYSGDDQFSGQNQNLLGSDGIGDVPYYINGSGAQDEYPLMEPWNEQNIIQIGVLVDLSSWLSDYGIDVKNAIEIARDDVNDYLIATNEPYRVELFIEDTQASPSEALNKTQFLYNNGIRQIIGPLSTQEFIDILDFTNSSKIILVSPSSTGPPQWFGITDPEERTYSFRFTPTELFEAKAIAKVAEYLGIKAVVILYVDSPWGSGLNESVVSELEGYNIEVNEIEKYPDPVPTDYSPYITSLENAVQGLGSQYNNSEIAVITINYGELSNILEQVPYGSVLLNTTWIGGNVAMGQSMPCDKANSVKLYSPIFESKGEGYEELNETFYSLYGTTPIGFSLNAYDALWVLALANVESHGFDPDKIAGNISLVADNYSKGSNAKSVSGNITFDEFNDRISGNYSIYAIKDCNWVNIGSWNIDTDSINIDTEYPPTKGRVHNINKDTNYSTIQDAIDDADPGDEIRVDSGTYYENINITKPVILLGIDTGGNLPLVDAMQINTAINLIADGITLRGFNVTNATFEGQGGIFIISNNNTISNNSAYSNAHGIVIYTSNNNTLTNNIANLNNIHGIILFNSNNNKIINNIVNLNAQGIFLDNSSNNNTLINNTVNWNLHGIGTELSFYNNLTGNTVNYNENAIFLKSSSDNTVIGNTAKVNAHGILLLESSENNTITDNIVSNNDNISIILDMSSSNTISNNTISNNNATGMTLVFSDHNNISNNNLTFNKGDGIWLNNSNYNEISENNASNNPVYNGISLRDSNFNNIFNNIADSNNLNGICLYLNDTNNNVVGNTLTNHIDFGIYLNESSHDNFIYNNFFSNPTNALDEGTNTWNITKILGLNIIGGPYLGGNFWAKPDGTGFSQTCADVDLDGICDLSYMLALDNVDYLPLAAVDAIPDTTFPILISNSPTQGEVNVPTTERTVSFTFDEKMQPDVSVTWWGLNEYYSASIDWSIDQKTVSFIFDKDLPDNTTISWVLNPSTHQPGFKDLAGNPLPADTYFGSFSTATAVEDQLIDTQNGIARLSTPEGFIDEASTVDESSLPAAPNVEFPFGVFSFNISNLSIGQTVNISIQLPHELSTDAQYWKFGRTISDTTPHWYEIPMEISSDNRSIKIQITDGGLGDDDLTANGKIVDPGAPGISRKGDFSGDGTTDAWDITYLARSISGIPGYETLSSGDVSGDGVVDAWDCTYLARAIAGVPGYEI